MIDPALARERLGHRHPKPHPSCGGAPETGFVWMSAKEVWKTIGAEDTAVFEARVKYTGN